MLSKVLNIILLIFCLTACTNASNKDIQSNLSKQWAYPFVIVNNIVYKIDLNEENKIEKEKVGDRLGVVKRNIVNNDYINLNENEVEKIPEENNWDSNYLEEGSGIYLMKGKSSSEIIIVEDKKEYRIAKPEK